ncbi:Aspartyl aminopeptidase [Paucidesulfovibrio gracilis DSM 16080]|uniref:M18 family aminopeptidase n=1 Tax=Paucidesulfovibrio gracilis DSM 16080 TaxID=1121449 RepID=A0A1T4WKE4_9BACT|nr:aminopeptidase [Paucidesulfovibrio gracilis]SKA77385.1 Aspartyl aminopeptidase [Paucidesulfovibrio gracilis DSM 16080]
MGALELEYKPVNGWRHFASPEHHQAMDALAERYLRFLSQCKTEREVMHFVREQLELAGFSEDFSAERCFRFSRGKTVFMARRGRRPLSEGFRLVGAHADAPRIDLKQRPLYDDMGLTLAKTHYYGGIRKYQWLTIPLALHGVVVKKDGTLVNICVGEDEDDPVLTITDLLPHLAYKQVEKKVSDAFEAEKLNVVLAHEPETGEDSDELGVKPALLQLLYDRYGIVEADLMSAELQIVPAGPARYVGLDRALLGSYAQDDRACVYSALEAFFSQPEEPEYTQIVLFWDKEEIGSEGATGAKSLFFEYCMEELRDAWEPETRLSKIFQAGQAISADVHAGTDPNFPDVYEKLNAAFLGYGPCFSKFTGHRGKVGANDAHPEFIGRLRSVLDDAGIPWQMGELGKVDAGGGGTVAKFLAVYGMDIIDMGPPVLSMHSPFEITSKVDIYSTTKAYAAFLAS